MAKLTFISISLIILGLIFSSPGYTIEQESVVLTWLFEEGQGTTVEDSSGNGNDGELIDGPQWAAGKFGGGLEFDGTDDSVVSSTVNGIGATYISETLWIKFAENFDGTENQFGFISCTDTASSRYFYFSSWVSGGPHSGIHLGTITPAPDGGWGRAISVPAGVFESGQWYHVAGVINNEEGSIRAYVDGELQHDQTFDVGDTPGTPTEIWVGGSPEGGRWINGVVDEVAFFNVALTEDDIKTIMTDGLAGEQPGTAVDPLRKLTTTWSKIKAD
jgi:hypothetical protein